LAKRGRSEPAASVDQRPDWGTPAARVRWLIDSRFGGNRSKFASAIGLSHTAINKVVSGDREPGRKLLVAVTQRLSVNPNWLLKGEDQPFRDHFAVAGHGIPVTTALLPGPPLEHLDQVTRGWVEIADQLFAPTQYWLSLTASQPLAGKPYRGFRAGDQLLMETDRARFPRAEKLFGRLCVVRFPEGTGALKLAGVTHYAADPDTGPEHLEADTFEEDTNPEKLIREEVYRHHPGGEVTHHQRLLQLKQIRGRERPVPLNQTAHVEPALPAIRYPDIVAVWLQILRRPSGLPV
jgi:hypothetical protein